jgi:predicted nucleic acid-binding protein
MHKVVLDTNVIISACISSVNAPGLIIDKLFFEDKATMSVPSNDHYLPMMYTLGLAQEKDELKYTFEGLFKLAE